MKNAPQTAIRMYVRPLIRGVEQHGFVWRLQRGKTEILSDIAATKELAESRALAARDAIVDGDRAHTTGAAP